MLNAAGDFVYGKYDTVKRIIVSKIESVDLVGQKSVIYYI